LVLSSDAPVGVAKPAKFTILGSPAQRRRAPERRRSRGAGGDSPGVQGRRRADRPPVGVTRQEHVRRRHRRGGFDRTVGGHATEGGSLPFFFVLRYDLENERDDAFHGS
jgi:hypothetical protein